MSIGEMERQLDAAELYPLVAQLKQNLESVIQGKSAVIENLIIALLVDESILVEDVPGVGKTTLAKSLAASVKADFQRVQCTPDLLPADIFGVSVFRPRDGEFEFRRGPVFSNILLVDEINRASPRTQSALLEAMAEHQVTVDGKTMELPRPFPGDCHTESAWVSGHVFVAGIAAGSIRDANFNGVSRSQR